MSGRTFREASEELDAAVRDLRNSLVEAFAAFPGVAWLMARLSVADERLERRFPRLAAMLERMPRWMMFGTSEFFRAIGLIYLVIVGLVLVRVLLT